MRLGKTKSEQIYSDNSENSVDISTPQYLKIYKKNPRGLPVPIKRESNEENENSESNNININNDFEIKKLSSEEEENSEEEKNSEENIIKEEKEEEKEEDKEEKIKNNEDTLKEIIIPKNDIIEPKLNIEEQKVEESINYDNYFKNYNMNINIQNLLQAQQNMFEMSKIKYNNENNKIKEKIMNMDDVKSCDLQNKYIEGNDLMRDNIFNYLKGKFLEKSLDGYYNYLIQLIIEEEGKRCYYKIKIIADELRGSYFILSDNPNGAYVVQKLIEYLENDLLKIITDEIISNKNFKSLVIGSNGNHVIQKLILYLDKDGEDFKNLFNEINKNLVDFCKKKYGCYIIQVLLDKCNIEYIYKITEQIKDENLLNDEYGLHVVQKILEIYDIKSKRFNLNFIYNYFKDIDIYDKIFNKDKSIATSFCKIIQLILQKGYKNDNINIINKLIENNKNFLLMCCDKYGNHVAQRVYDNSNKDTQDKIKELIQKNINQYKNINYFKFVQRHIFN